MAKRITETLSLLGSPNILWPSQSWEYWSVLWFLRLIVLLGSNFALHVEVLAVSLLWYDTTEEFNVDSKAECGQLNLAHKTKTDMLVPT